MQTIVSPSLLSCDFLNIEKELSYFQNLKNIWLHLDIMDGHFVPNLTFGHPIIKMIAQKTSLPLDAHFMVTNPLFYIETLKDVSLFNFTFHIEAASENTLKIIQMAKNSFPSVGISLRPQTPISLLTKDILENVNLVLVMSVEPGFGGQTFIESTLDKVLFLDEYRKKNKLSFQIQIDGGISDTNAPLVRKKGVDNLVAGSYIFKDGPKTYIDKIEKLRN